MFPFYKIKHKNFQKEKYIGKKTPKKLTNTSLILKTLYQNIQNINISYLDK